MISIMQREIVDRHGWLDEEEFLDQLAVAQSMPGADRALVITGAMIRATTAGRIPMNTLLNTGLCLPI